MQKYEKVLKLMQTKGGRLEVDDPDLNALLGEVAYRLPTFIWCIRKYAHLEVRGIRTGRKVVTYELVAVAPPDETPQPAPVNV